MIKNKLRIVMAIQNVSQKDLSALTGIRPSTISDMMNNRSKHLSVDNLNILCEKLHCTVPDLLEYVPDEQ